MGAFRARIWHEPWPLREASVEFYESTMIESHRLATPSGQPLTHYAERIDVEVWPLKEVQTLLVSGSG